MKTIHIVIVIAIILAIAGGITYYNMMIRRETVTTNTVTTSPESSTTPTQTTESTTPMSPTTTPTTTTARQQNITEGLENCSEPALVYVYVNSNQEQKAKAFLNTFIREAGRQGIDLSNVRLCMVNATSRGWNLRLYPSIVVKGEVPSLKRYLEDSVEGYGVLDYSISEAIARYLKVNVTFTYTAKVYIVEGTTNWTHVNFNITDKLVKILQSIALARIEGVEKTTNPPVNVPYRPALLFYSKNNLSKGIIYLESIGENYYTITRQYMIMLATNIFGTRFIEVYFKPNITETVVVGNSNAPVTLYVFEDYWCPYCARFYSINEKVLEKLISNRTLKLVPLDFIVHREIAGLHVFMRCLYDISGNGLAYYNVTVKLYEELLSGKKPNVDMAAKYAEDIVGKDVVDKARNCVGNRTLINLVLNETMSYNREYGVRATPTLLFYNYGLGKGMLIEGYIGSKDFENIVKWLTSS